MQGFQVSPVDIRDIAAVAAAVLTGSGHERNSYVITGPESSTYAEIADKVSAAIGKKVTYVGVPFEQARKPMIESGAPAWFVDDQMEQYQVRLKGYEAAVTTVVSFRSCEKETDLVRPVLLGIMRPIFGDQATALSR